MEPIKGSASDKEKQKTGQKKKKKKKKKKKRKKISYTEFDWKMRENNKIWTTPAFSGGKFFLRHNFGQGKQKGERGRFFNLLKGSSTTRVGDGPSRS